MEKKKRNQIFYRKFAMISTKDHLGINVFLQHIQILNNLSNHGRYSWCSPPTPPFFKANCSFSIAYNYFLGFSWRRMICSHCCGEGFWGVHWSNCVVAELLKRKMEGANEAQGSCCKNQHCILQFSSNLSPILLYILSKNLICIILSPLG